LRWIDFWLPLDIRSSATGWRAVVPVSVYGCLGMVYNLDREEEGVIGAEPADLHGGVAGYRPGALRA
jgi:hypothetical protein